MSDYHPPETTRDWTFADLDLLVGAYVIVEVPASDAYREDGGEGDWEGAAGVCVYAGFAAYPEAPRTAFVDLAHGGGWTWPAAEGAHISVCHDHGDHSSADSRACLAQLGVRGAGREVAHV